MTRTILAAAALLLPGGAAYAECDTITFDQFKALEMGSSYAAAVKAMGCEGQEMSRFEIQVPEFPSLRMTTLSTVMYMWRTAAPIPTVTAMFQNDKMISRSQFGLPENHPEPLSKGSTIGQR